jgi:uncharacterized protein (TIGR02001 family)
MMKAIIFFTETSAIRPWHRRGPLGGPAVPIAALSLAVALSADCAHAAADISSLLRLTSNYEYRGYSLSDNHAAVQANIDVAWSSGLFLGTWISSADFGNADLVLNPYVGKPFDLSPDWQVVTSVAGYLFDGEVQNTNASYAEAAVRLAYRDIVSMQVNIAPDYYGTGSTVPSYEIGLSCPLSDVVEVSGGIGYQASRDALDYDGLYSNVGVAWFILPNLTLDIRYHNLHEMNERPHENYGPEPLAQYHLDTPVILSVSIGL